MISQTIYPFSPVGQQLDHPGLTVPPDGHHRELSHQYFPLSFFYLQVKSWIGLLILCDSIPFSHNHTTLLSCSGVHLFHAILPFPLRPLPSWTFPFPGPPLPLPNLCSFHRVSPAFPTLNRLVQEISSPSLWVKILLV